MPFIWLSGHRLQEGRCLLESSILVTNLLVWRIIARICRREHRRLHNEKTKFTVWREFKPGIREWASKTFSAASVKNSIATNLPPISHETAVFLFTIFQWFFRIPRCSQSCIRFLAQPCNFPGICYSCGHYGSTHATYAVTHRKPTLSPRFDTARNGRV